jgi:PTH1 family peptidyl-tRNA hydrolase
MAVELVLGLGNPGPGYVRTRHNAGFMVVDELHRRHGLGPWARRHGCDVTAVSLARTVILAKPQGFMNRSGTAAAELAAGLGLDPGQLLVVVDDVDLPLGRLRLRAAGGPGTHNGLRDICEQLGNDVPRLRLGVRGPGPVGELADYVLSTLPAAEVEAFEAAVGRAADAVACAISDGLERTMNAFNQPLESAAID